MADSIGRDLDELVALIRLHFAKAAVEEISLEVEMEVRGTLRVQVCWQVIGMMKFSRRRI
jgi:hypothetical protein